MTTPGEPVSSQLCALWATEDDLPDAKPDLPPGATWDDLLLVASELLWALSGRQWSGTGDCEATARLVRERGRCVGWWHDGALAGWQGFVSRPASIAQRDVKLPHDEVTEVVSVTSGDDAFTAYELRGSWLHRSDGGGWNERDFEITYRWGLAPPAGGVRAAAAYAMELGKAVAGDSSCRLPKRVVSVTRQGVSMTMIDPQTYLDKGKLGIPDIDQWLASVNPSAVPERATIWSPDVPHARLV